MDEPNKKSLTQQALDQLPENELNAKVTTDDGKTVAGKLSIQKTWRNGWGLGIFGQGKAGTGQKPDLAAGFEVRKKLD